jgi:hypothetical protein
MYKLAERFINHISSIKSHNGIIRRELAFNRWTTSESRLHFPAQRSERSEFINFKKVFPSK